MSIYICIHLCIHICIYMYMCVYVYKFIYIYVYMCTSLYIYIYIFHIARPPPPRSTLRGSKAFALRTPSTYALERKTEREQERRREFITRKKDRENKQIRTCVPVL